MTRRTFLLAALIAAGCDRGPTPEGNTASSSEPSPTQEAAATEAPTDVPIAPPARRPPSPVVSADAPNLAGVAWSVHEPLVWRPPSTPMRNAEYAVGDGDTAAVLTVFHFPGMGGSIDDNIRRWTGQFSGGEPAINTRTISGLDVTTVDVTGTFTNAMPMGGNAGPQENQRLLGAIVAGPNGPIFFKLLGPSETVARASQAFADLVGSFRAS